MTRHDQPDQVRAENRFCGARCRCQWCRAGISSNRSEGLGDELSGRLVAAVAAYFSETGAA